ncbi:MAG: YdgA family protein [Gammaproteobacteria bacterium]|nr:YdgA family protein [Gammaproteobacteria bacterium]
MNIVAKLTTALPLAVFLTASSPVWAAAPPSAGAQAAPASGQTALKYQLNDGPAATAKGTDPFSPLLEIIKKSIALGKQKPGTPVQAKVELPAPEEMTEALGELPSLLINTVISSNGVGRSDLSIEEFRREETKEGKKGLIHWRGLTGQVDFTGDLQKPSIRLNTPGLYMKQDGEVEISLNTVTLAAVLDEFSQPEKLNFNLPELKVKALAEDGGLDIRNVKFNLNAREAKPGLKLGNVVFQIDRLAFQDKGLETELQGLAINADSNLAEDRINNAVEIKLGNLSIPAALTPTGKREQVSYVSNLELRGLDANIIAEIQQTLRDLQASGASEEMIAMSLLGKFMETGPGLLKKSPELALTNLNIKTGKGELNGSLAIRVDGGKFSGNAPVQWNNPVFIKSALSANAEFTVSKALLAAGFDNEIRTSLAQRRQKPKTADGKPAKPAPQPTDKQIAEIVESQIQGLIAQNLLAPSGPDAYKLVANFKDSKLILNGKEMPLPF